MTIAKYETVTAAAKIIGCTRGRVYQLIHAGEIQAVCVSDSVWLVPRREAQRVARQEHRSGRPRSGNKATK